MFFFNLFRHFFNNTIYSFLKYYNIIIFFKIIITFIFSRYLKYYKIIIN